MTGHDPVSVLEYAATPARGRSWLGIISFGLAILAGAFVSGGYGMVWVFSLPEPPIEDFGMLLGFAAVLLSLAGMVLGICAVVQRNKKRLFGVLGLVLNGTILLGLLGLMLLPAVLHTL